MKCKECGGLGWFDTHYGGGASWTRKLSQCPIRCNIKGYSDEVQRRLNDKGYFTEQPVLLAEQTIKPEKREPKRFIPNYIKRIK